MRSRSISLILSLLVVLLVVLVGILTEFATSDPSRLPPVLELLQRWSVPLLGVTVLLLVAGTVWQHLVEPRPPATPAWTAKRPPYPGLEAFTEQDAAVFFGRGPQITELVDRLHPTLPRQAHRFVAVVGPSGAGKSSLVQAGLLPSLAGRRTRWVVVPPLVPENHPTKKLACSLAAVLPDSQVETLAAQLAEGPAALAKLAAGVACGSRRPTSVGAAGDRSGRGAVDPYKRAGACSVPAVAAWRTRSGPWPVGGGHAAFGVPHRVLGDRVLGPVPAAGDDRGAGPRRVG